jgi:hypothetical protein
MKKVFLTFMFFGFTLALAAQGLQNGLIQQNPPSQEKPKQKSFFEAGLELSSYTYKEPGPGVKLSGVKTGVSAQYLYRARPEEQSAFFALQAAYMTGKVDYDGALFNGVERIPYRYDGLSDYYWEARGLFGTFAPLGDVELQPFFGLGYRYLFNGLGQSPEGGYDRISQYVYSPLGINAVVQLPANWVFTGMLEYDLFWKGKQKSDLSGGAVSNDQRRGWGLRLAARFAKNLQNVTIFAQPFFRMWNIGDSDVAYAPSLGDFIIEPRNKTQEYGLKAGVMF